MAAFYLAGYSRRTWPTFEEAERAARRNFKRGSGGTAIWSRSTLIAFIARDGYGKVWTDLTVAGAELI